MSTEKKIDDGGAAFPAARLRDVDGRVVEAFGAPGMSLRDYFAAKAMQALLQRGWVASGDGDDSKPIHYTEEPSDCDVGPEALANDAYGIADAMIAARKAVPDAR